ncbi:Hypothetical protein, conserved [Brucella canis ATCC 23365]|uniref:Uncharacterized protein n=1 Tax=Brucella canis (strain ATCC 23365 / NCTC 10854 / RM-666) TaxID=483179 RepID=A9M5K4_BRUC2|nr:Hypothetical protein, conserved [Brucella canis ATCC 23365]EEX82650.1 predicted protein [Brucella abortus bv. 3 str. Tulya]
MEKARHHPALISHDLIRKPVPTFWGHAMAMIRFI